MRYHAIKITRDNESLVELIAPLISHEDNLNNWLIIPEDGSAPITMTDFGFASRFAECEITSQPTQLIESP